MEGVLRQGLSRSAVLPIFIACSLLLHGAAVAVATRAARRAVEPTPVSPPVELVMVEVEAPKPAAPEPAPVPTPRPAIKLAPTPPKAKRPTPPPPNESAPEPPKQAPVVIGLTMSSTTTGGSFAAPVGNTLYGSTDRKAPDPAQAKPYAAPAHWAPAYELDTEPVVLSEVKIPYPPAAQRDWIEGTVVASIVIDEEGKVVSAKVLSGPGHGLNEAAQEAFSRFRFKPPTKGGRPVSTEIKYRYTFVLN
jgi:protein TonB